MLIDERELAQRAALIAKRNDVLARMRATTDDATLRRLRAYARDLYDAAQPDVDWLWWYQQIGIVCTDGYGA